MPHLEIDGPLFILGHGGFSSQTLSSQSSVVSLEGFLCLFVFRDDCLAGTKSLVRLSLSGCERFTCFVTHRSPPMTVTGENTIVRPRCARNETRSLSLISPSRINSGTVEPPHPERASALGELIGGDSAYSGSPASRNAASTLLTHAARMKDLTHV